MITVKLLEFLSRIENDFLNNNVSFPHNVQLGFRSTIPAYYVLKEAIIYYVYKDYPVFCSILDNKESV